MNAQDTRPKHPQTSPDQPEAGDETQSIDLYIDDQRWATLSRDNDGVSLEVAECRDGQPWRIGADSLKQTLASARKLLGA